MSMPTTSTPESPVGRPLLMHEVEMPRVISAERAAPMAEGNSQEHRFYLKDGNVKFELDDGTLYNVHRYFFETHAPKFTEDHLGDPERSTPIKLAAVSSVDFQRFLSVVYPTKLGKCDIHTIDEWTSVLRLANRWSIDSLSELAIEEIKPKASPFDKVTIAREFDLGPGWLLPAFVDICQRPNWLKRDEAERLGLPTVVEIGRIREEARMVGQSFNTLAAVRASEVLVLGGQDEGQDSGSAPQAPPMPPTSLANVHESTTDTSASLDAQSSPAPSSSPQTPPLSVPAFPSRPTEHDALIEISDQLAYLTLHSAEIAEEAKHTTTPLNRALFAMNLMRRMKRETSPAALRHRAWRQTCVNIIILDLAGPGCLTEQANVLSACSPSVSAIQTRLARLLCARLSVELSSSFIGSLPEAFLLVDPKDSIHPARESAKVDLESTGWKATHIGHRALHVSIPDWDCSDEDMPRYT